MEKMFIEKCFWAKNGTFGVKSLPNVPFLSKKFLSKKYILLKSYIIFLIYTICTSHTLLRTML